MHNTRYRSPAWIGFFASSIARNEFSRLDAGKRIFESQGEMTMIPVSSFHCAVEKSKDRDELGNRVTTVKCHGRLVSENAEEFKEAVKPLLPLGGRIIVDFSDVSHLDSSGLGTLVGLKASAIRQGYCILEFANMTPRILELVRITNLMQMFSSATGIKDRST
jgi:anti-anti-sigma factor